jgi:hypothetical protein
MADKHPSGNPRLVEQHKKIQRKGDQELEQDWVPTTEQSPGRGKPDKEEGVGTAQRRKG